MRTCRKSVLLGVTLGVAFTATTAAAQQSSVATSPRQLRENGTSALLDSAWRQHLAGRSGAALELLRGITAQLREIGDRRGEAAALSLTAQVYHRRANPDLRTALAYYDSAATARAFGVATEFRALGDTLSRDITERETRVFQEWALARLGVRGSGGRTRDVLAALAIAERGRAHRFLNLRQRHQGTLHLTRIAGGDPAEEGESLILFAMGLGERTTALVYMLAADTLLVWLIDPGGDVELIRQPVHLDSLASQILHLRAAMGGDPAANAARNAFALRLEDASLRGFDWEQAARVPWEQAAAALSRVLLPPDVMSRLPDSGNLLVVPDGSIGFVPFAALPLETGQPLGRKIAVRYAPSLTVAHSVATYGGALRPFTYSAAAAADTGLIRMGWRRVTDSLMAVRAEWLRRSLVVGNPAMPSVTSAAGQVIRLPPLRGAEAEARWVGAQFGVSPKTGADAREAGIRAAIPGATVVHLATHGYAYTTRARGRDSFVALASGEGHDGVLSVGEVLDELPQLSADLVVLSACQTGVGDLQEGEGTVGLQYAFLAKGARSVLVSLWNVSDDATELLMKRFYHHWLTGDLTKPEALRRAQEDVRGTRQFEHPAFWAAFQLVGAP